MAKYLGPGCSSGPLALEKKKDIFAITNNICVCCLKRDVEYIRLSTCKHAGSFGKVFHYKTYLPLKLICHECHALLVKVMAFKIQVEQSINWLNHVYIQEKEDLPMVKPNFSFGRTSIDISYTVNSEPLAYEEISPEEIKTNLLANQKRAALRLANESTNKQTAAPPLAQVITNQKSHYMVLMPLVTRDGSQETPMHEELDLPIEVKIEPEDFNSDEDVPLSHIDVGPNSQKRNITHKPAILETLLTRPRDVKKAPVKKKKPAETAKEQPPMKRKLAEDLYAGKIRTVTLSKDEYLQEREQERTKDSFLQLPYRCDDCIVGFDYEVTLQEHMEKKHGKVITSSLPESRSYNLKIVSVNSLNTTEKDPLSLETDTTELSTQFNIKTESNDNLNDETYDNNDDDDDENISMTTKKNDNVDGEIDDKNSGQHNNEELLIKTESKDNTDWLVIDIDDSDDSDDELDSNVDTELQTKKEDIWILEKKIFDQDLAMKFINSIKTWTLHTEISNDKKKYYRCNGAPEGSCKAGVLMSFESPKRILVYRNNEKHSCGESSMNLIEPNVGRKNNKKFKNPKMKAEIDELILKNLKFGKIEKILKEKYDKDSLPSKCQLNTYIQRSSRKLFSEKAKMSKISLSFTELYTWIEKYKDVPFVIDEVFVLNHVIENDNTKFRFIISTKRLLKNALEIDNLTLHTNLTHKWLWYENSVILIGTTDRDENFHLLAIAICSQTTEEDFEFIFDSLKTSFRKLFSEELTPKVLVSDTSDVIQHGFRKVFPSCPIRICWNHMRAIVQSDQKHLSDIHDLLKDLDFVQASEDRILFEKSFELFLKKWGVMHSGFFTYMTVNWVGKNAGWYESFCPGTPSTNCSLEWASHDLKIEHNVPEKLHPKRFCSLIKTVVEARSVKYKNQRIVISHTVTITPKLWKDACEWTFLNKNIHLICENDVEKEYVIPCGDNVDIDLKNTVVDNVGNFDNYVTIKSSFCKLYLPNDIQYWQNGRCTCANFIKTLACKHLYGVAIMLQYASPPKEVIWRINQKQKSKVTLHTKCGRRQKRLGLATA